MHMKFTDTTAAEAMEMDLHDPYEAMTTQNQKWLGSDGATKIIAEAKQRMANEGEIQGELAHGNLRSNVVPFNREGGEGNRGL